jgi:hypothetical protein
MSERGYSIGDLVDTTKEFCEYKNKPTTRIDDVWYENETFKITREWDNGFVVLTYMGTPMVNTLCPVSLISDMLARYKSNHPTKLSSGENG